ncbi:MAG TPA: cytochrome c oxidase subunit II [Armatimonadaceae bacterium]|nr:cytochrome c oxidase subunit II [Armatimonadaceae bacterium]
MGELPFRPVAASSYAEDVDRLFFVLVALTVFFTSAVGITVLALAARYRRGNKVDRSRPSSHNTLLELSWTIPPIFLGLGVFFWSAKIYTQAYAVPENAKEIFVVGKQWMWHIQHSNGIRENNELHIPVGEPVKLTMISQDVIHAFYVPEFRLQRQVEPGQYSSFYFTPTKTGRYHLYCNMYCGTQHSLMGGWVYVMSKADYQKWAASGGSQPVAPGGTPSKTGGLTLTQRGASLYEKFQCNSCHDPAAVQRGRGPSLVGLYGKTRQLADGRKVKADDGYLRNVLYYPAEYPLAGWAVGMPSYKGVLTEEEVLQINAYVKSLKPTAQQSGAGTGGGATAAAAPVPATAAAPTGAAGAPADTAGGNVERNAPAANTDNIQFRHMYGGEQQGQ